MIYLFGDSHAMFSFRNLPLEHTDLHCSSITMFRIGRDKQIIHFNKDNLKIGDIVVLSYGEVDCRCHIQRQINLGNHEDVVIQELVDNYFDTIKKNIVIDVKVVIVGIIPPTKQYDYEKINGPIQHEFPFVGSDEDRVRFTRKVNNYMNEEANKYGYIFFNPYSFYTREDGTLKYELSDTIVHIRNNSFFLNKFIELF